MAPIAEVKCACEPTVTHGGEGCTYAEGKGGSPCTHTHGVKVDSADSCYKLLCSHKDGGHDDSCGYAAAVEAHECHYECAECAAALTADETTEPSTEATEPFTEATEPAPVCDCGTDDDSIHATNCQAYVAPENPECYCAEHCTEDNINIWCDVCGVQGMESCKGEDTAAVYAGETTTVYVGGYTESDAAQPLSTETKYVVNTDGKVSVNENAETNYFILTSDATSGYILTVTGEVTISAAYEIKVSEEGQYSSIPSTPPMTSPSPAAS